MNLVVKSIKTKNPWLHRSLATISREAKPEESDFVVQDSGKVQTTTCRSARCAPSWLCTGHRTRSETSPSFATVSRTRQEAIVTVAVNNPDNDLQIIWTKKLTGFSEIKKEQLEHLVAGDRLILYGPIHVTALKVIPPMQAENNCEVYDPETASVDYWNLGVWVGMSGATKFLSSRAL